MGFLNVLYQWVNHVTPLLPPFYDFSLSSERNPESSPTSLCFFSLAHVSSTSLRTFHSQRPCSVLHKHRFLLRTCAHDNSYAWTTFPWVHNIASFRTLFKYHLPGDFSSTTCFSFHLLSFSPARMQAFVFFIAISILIATSIAPRMLPGLECTFNE